MELDNGTKVYIQQLQEAMRQNRLVVFVGAGVSASAGVPTWQGLTESLKRSLPQNISSSNDMLKIAQMYYEHSGDIVYLDAIKRTLRDGQVGCNEVHDAIMKLNPCYIVTTNYDDLLEQSAIHNNKQYYVVAKDEHLPANQGEKMIIKMHGDFREGNIVLTENDYYDYSRNFPLIRSFLLSLFATKVVLFIGFSFDDINLKYILREISSLLNSKMRRVYLLVDEQKSITEHTYFLNKGIQLVCLPQELTSAVLEAQNVSYSNEGLFDEKAKALNQSLNMICSYNPFYNDLIARVINFLDTYSEQIRFWGEYMCRALVDNKGRHFHLRQQDLSLPKEYDEWFQSVVATRDSYRMFKTKCGDKLDRLIDRLLDNRIVRVNGRKISSKSHINKIEEQKQRSVIRYIYSLAFDKMEKRYMELKHRQKTNTIDDLELPFLLFKLGRYYDAYAEYKMLAPKMWRHRKYVLYFICLYNIKSLSSRVSHEILLCKHMNINDFYDELDAIHLKEILADLPIDPTVKSLLEEIETGGLLMKNWIEVSRLNEEILAQRKRAEKGGMSINSNIAILLDNFDQSFFFCNENYILNECYAHSQNAYKKMVEGIINSIMTQDKDGWQSKIDELTLRNFILFVFMVKPDNLSEMLGRLVVGNILVDDEFKKSLKVICHNLVEESRNTRELMDPSLVADYLKNVILMLNAIEDSPSIPDIYNPIIKYWYIGRFVEFVPELTKLQERQCPSAKEAIMLIDCILHSRTIVFAKGLENYVSTLANIAKEGGEVLDNFISIEQITGLKKNVLISTFYWVIPERYRQELIDYLREHVDSLYDLCFMENYTGAHIITPELIEKLKDTISNGAQNYPWIEPHTCSMLLKMVDNEEYSDIVDVIKSFKEEKECFRFLSSPLQYERLTKVKGVWLMFIEDNELKALLKRKIIRQIIAREFPWDKLEYKSFEKKVWDLMN